MPRKRKRGAGLQIKHKSNKKRVPKIAQSKKSNTLEKPHGNNGETRPPMADCNIVAEDDCLDDIEEETVPYYNAVKYEALRMKITSTALRYGVMVLFVNKYQGLDDIKEGVDVQSSWVGKGGLISKIKKILDSKGPIQSRSGPSLWIYSTVPDVAKHSTRSCWRIVVDTSLVSF